MFEGKTKLDSLEDFKFNAEQKYSASQTIRYYSHSVSKILWRAFLHTALSKTKWTELCNHNSGKDRKTKQEPVNSNFEKVSKYW